MFSRHNNNESRGLIVSIGAGRNQIPLIREAKNAGFHVLGVDQNSAAPGLLLCDLKIQESIVNYEEIFNKIQEFLYDGKLRGVLTRSYGDAVRTTAFINEFLKVPYIPSKRIEDLIDKNRMKGILEQNGIPTPDYSRINSASQIRKYPVVLKPIIGHAKSGVAFIENVKEAEEYLKKQSEKTTILCESYIHGNEVIVLGIAKEGKFRIFDITDKLTSPLPYFVDIQHSAPSRYMERWNELEKIGQRVIEGFGINTSPVVMEIRFDRNENPFVIEVVPEFGGEYLADTLLPKRSGINFIRQAINAITGEEIEYPNPKKMGDAVVVKYMTSRTGIIESCVDKIDQTDKMVIHSELFARKGSVVNAPVSNHDRIGVVIARGRDVPSALHSTEKAIYRYSIRTKVKKEK